MSATPTNYPEFYITNARGEMFVPRADGCRFASGFPKCWKKNETAQKWISLALEMDATARVVDNTVTF